MYYKVSKVVYMYSSLLQMAPGSCYLSQADKRIIVMQSWADSQDDNNFHSKWHFCSSRTILSCFLLVCLALYITYSLPTYLESMIGQIAIETNGFY